MEPLTGAKYYGTFMNSVQFMFIDFILGHLQFLSVQCRAEIHLAFHINVKIFQKKRPQAKMKHNFEDGKSLIHTILLYICPDRAPV